MQTARKGPGLNSCQNHLVLAPFLPQRVSWDKEHRRKKFQLVLRTKGSSRWSCERVESNSPGIEPPIRLDPLVFTLSMGRGSRLDRRCLPFIFILRMQLFFRTSNDIDFRLQPRTYQTPRNRCGCSNGSAVIVLRRRGWELPEGNSLLYVKPCAFTGHAREGALCAMMPTWRLVRYSPSSFPSLVSPQDNPQAEKPFCIHWRQGYFSYCAQLNTLKISNVMPKL